VRLSFCAPALCSHFPADRPWFFALPGILLNSKNVLGKNLFRTLFYMPTMIPVVAVVLIWAGVLNEQTGWINVFIERTTGIKAVGTQGLRWLADPSLVYYAYTMFGLWGVGNAMIIFLAGLQGVPTELYEAAEIDGANWFQRLFSITIPMITPVIFYQLVLGVIGSLQYFLAPFVLNRGTGFPEGMTRFYMVYFYKQSFSFFSMGYGATLAWLMFIFALIVTIASVWNSQILGVLCLGGKIMPAKTNPRVISQKVRKTLSIVAITGLALAVLFPLYDPDGVWDCNSPQNRFAVFQDWRALVARHRRQI
jgi:ABC-type sugar transport system permease subunit